MIPSSPTASPFSFTAKSFVWSASLLNSARVRVEAAVDSNSARRIRRVSSDTFTIERISFLVPIHEEL